MIAGKSAFAAGCTLVLWGLVGGTSFAFGGEDIAQGKPWHHEHITLAALTESDKHDPEDLYTPRVTFPGGAQAIAWHADNIDSYLYNPYFWAKGALESSAPGRIRAALVGFEGLAKLHFDDTFTNSGLQANWERYAMGTLIGLVWASELPRDEGIAAGHQLLGISFHAVQDFYSHSSWVSRPDRRCLTYFETPKERRDGMSLFAGAYETPESGAPAHHGAYSLSCSVFKRDGINEALGTLCGGLSPLQNASMCESYRACGDAGKVDARVGEPLFSGGMLIYTNPPGIALDNTALARTQAPNRGLIDADKTFSLGADGMHFPRDRCKDIVHSKGGKVCAKGEDADQVFAGTKDLAIRATMQWAEYLEEQMYALGKGPYWESLKSSSSTVAQRSAQYEDFSKLPYQFIAAGDYPVGNPVRNPGDDPAAARGWFLRLRIRTADNLTAGTNADIYARVNFASGPSRDVLLDYLPTDDKTGRTTNRLLVYDDFEAGNDDAYTIGPFNERPVSVALVNDSAGAGDVFDALIEDFSNGIDETLTDARQFLIGFIGGNADFVGSEVKSYTVDSLDSRFGERGRWFVDTLSVDGGDEGHHEIVYAVRRTRSGLTREQREDGWTAVEIELQKLKTIEESEVDRGSDSDEPFVIFHVAPLNGEADASYTYMSRPFEDMDDGEEKQFRPRRGRKFVARIPPEGIIVVSGAVYESDDETQSDREVLKTKFVTGMDEETQRPASEFGDALGRAIAEDWEVDTLEVYAFNRSTYPLAGPVLARTKVGDIDGDEVSEDFTLDWGNLTDFSNIEPIMQLERPVPDAKTLLQGVWHSENYQCAGKIPYVQVEVEPKDGDPDNRTEIIATKVQAEGDQCVDDIEEGRTFRGAFEDGRLVGERYIVPPPRDRRVEFNPDDPLDLKPDWFDPAIDPNISYEGNWMVTWSGETNEPPAMAVLSKGGRYSMGDLSLNDTHIHFRRDPGAAWQVNFWQPPEGAAIAQSDSAQFAGGRLKVEWPYYTLNQWGGDTELSLGGDVLTGKWVTGSGDNEKTGAERWVRMKPSVTAVGVVNDGTPDRQPLGKPVTVKTKYVGHGADLRGNRSKIKLHLFGENLWGRQHVFMPWFTRMEIRRLDAICKGGDPYDPANQTSWQRCMERSGGVAGLAVTLTVWPQAYSGEHILYVNDQEIPFTLDVIDEPLRDAEWQDMEMEFQSCNVLQEVNRDYNDQPFKLVRADFRPKGQRTARADEP